MVELERPPGGRMIPRFVIPPPDGAIRAGIGHLRLKVESVEHHEPRGRQLARVRKRHDVDAVEDEASHGRPVDATPCFGLTDEGVPEVRVVTRPRSPRRLRVGKVESSGPSPDVPVPLTARTSPDDHERVRQGIADRGANSQLGALEATLDRFRERRKTERLVHGSEILAPLCGHRLARGEPQRRGKYHAPDGPDCPSRPHTAPCDAMTTLTPQRPRPASPGTGSGFLPRARSSRGSRLRRRRVRARGRSRRTRVPSSGRWRGRCSGPRRPAPTG